MQIRTIKVKASVYTAEKLYSEIEFEVEFWSQAMAIHFMKYKDKPDIMPANKLSITKIEFTFNHGC